MNKWLLIRNPEWFQGVHKLKKKKGYFEGWYFKQTNGRDTVSIIPGISIDSSVKKAFIQVITKEESYFVNYDIHDFEYGVNPFFIRIGKNYFSEEKMYLNIKTDAISMTGKITYSNHQNLKKKMMRPNIMGPFSYLPFLECHHAILSMKNKAVGNICIGKKKFCFRKGIGYIEKDGGSSFPKSYIWLQGNNFTRKNASFMVSIAEIPLYGLHFKGLIALVMIGKREYLFTTYHGSKIVKWEIGKDRLEIVLKREDYFLYITSFIKEGNPLIAPLKGKMQKEIIESVDSSISVVLKKKSEIIFCDQSSNCGLEIVL